MLKQFWISFFLIALFFLPSCDDVSLDEETAIPNPLLEVSDISFSPDYKSYDVYASIKDASMLIDESNIDSALVREYNHNAGLVSPQFTARITEVDNIGARIIDSIGIKLLVIVDLTLPQNLVDSQLVYVQCIRRLYSYDNLYLSFLHSDSISSSVLVSDYILTHSFVSESDTLSTSKRLYSAIYDKITELYDSTSAVGSSKLSALIVFSDGNIYNIDATPIDPDHYHLQKDILGAVPDHTGRPIYYFNIDNSKQGAVNDAVNFLQLLTDKTCGFYSDSFDWHRCENEMLNRLDVRYFDYCIHFENPDDRLYEGDNNIQVFFNNGDSVVCLLNTSFSVGTTCKPVIVNGKPQSQIILQGFLISILLILIVYLVCQFIIPYVLYRVFRHRHVTVYHGPNTTLNGVMVADTCYYCKAPFRPGDSVVAKCEHTVHESCWQENDCRCPEYGHKCKTGSHYYNLSNLFDSRNALFYRDWLMMSVVIAFIAWFGFIVYDQEISYNFFLKIYTRIKNIPADSAEMLLAISTLTNKLDQLPSFGAFLGFVLTFCVGIMVCPYYTIWRRMKYILIRSVISGFVGFLLFLLGFLITIATNADISSIWIDWLPWTGTAFFSVISATYRTFYKPRHKWLIGMLTVGFFSMFLWDIIFSSSSSDYRLLLFVSNLVFVLGVTLSIASPERKSHNFVLNISGCVKQMNVALYKYFIHSQNSHVTIGKSIDCSIQTSWDIQGSVSALHAEIIMYKGHLCLVPLEDGVYFGTRMLKVGHRYELYHVRSFTIGTTKFKFLERDLH